MGKRRKFSAEFKARVALESMIGDKTLAELASKHDVHPNMIAQWKRQAQERLPEVFVQGCLAERGGPGGGDPGAARKDRGVAGDLRTIYTAPTAEEGAGRVLCEVGRWLPDDQPEPAGELGEPDPILRLPAGAAQSHLYDQCERIDECAAEESDQKERSVPHPGLGSPSDVPGDDPGHDALESTRQGPARRPHSPHHRLRRPHPGIPTAIRTETHAPPKAATCFRSRV